MEYKYLKCSNCNQEYSIELDVFWSNSNTPLTSLDELKPCCDNPDIHTTLGICNTPLPMDITEFVKRGGRVTELKIDRDKMLKAAEGCEAAKKVFEELWPEEFEGYVHDEYGAQYSWEKQIYQVVRVGDGMKMLVCINGANYYDGPYAGSHQYPLDNILFKKHLKELIDSNYDCDTKFSHIEYIGKAF